MKSRFRGYYPPSHDELAELWNDGVVILDTNALLNLFRYTADTRNSFLTLLAERVESLWLPHQVGLEFHRRRLEVINMQGRAFVDIDESLTSAKNSVQAAINKFKRHPSLDTAGLSELLETSIRDIANGLAKARASHDADVVGAHAIEATFDSITALYEGKVGEPFGDSELKAIHDEGEVRYAESIPPGYKDKAKDGTAKYGDLVLWRQILDYGRAMQKPAIFVTDDSKEDWWYIVEGKTQGPRVELIDEYFDSAKARIHFYSPERFLAYAQERGSQISASSLDEVEQVSTARAGRSAPQVNDLLHEREVLRRHLHTNLLERREEAGGVGLRETLNIVRSLEDRLDELSARISSIQDDLAHEDVDGNRVQALEMREGLLAEQSHLTSQLATLTRHLDVLQRRRRRDAHLRADSRDLERRLTEIDDRLRDAGYFDLDE
ncbi:PIN-like domain-containing protein [Agromyces endophyticus]|uniref:PIN-like domain-containing protein n=1 Tax=Agromyces sp. H17E-10 TaxID=2932244 RepID=UPI001FD4D0E1|nr:PIN-like domain-containing protein [Agromyces sp. H17E-10]UOQ90163.1 PIN-like domain-containing protein [Agromyces sp. H17E-10]